MSRAAKAKEIGFITSDMHDIVTSIYEHVCDNEIDAAKDKALELIEELRYLLKNIDDDFRD